MSIWLGPPACQTRITERARVPEDFCAARSRSRSGKSQAAKGQAADFQEAAAADAVAGAVAAADEIEHEFPPQAHGRHVRGLPRQ